MNRITVALENGFEGKVIASFDLEEYAEQTRAEVINECIDILHNHYEVRNAEQNAFMDMLVMEFLRLKEQK